VPFNPQIRQLQADLSCMGYTPGPLDGFWGPRTATAAWNLRLREGIENREVGPAFYVAVERLMIAERHTAAELDASQMGVLFPLGEAAYLEPLNAAMWDGALDRTRAISFLAQLGHESGGLRWFEEIASGEAYEGRADLGNTEPGDGKRYKGRGPIQLTGRANYRRFGSLLGLDLENYPKSAATPEIGFRVAVMYWTDRNLNALADLGDFEGITRAINGGLNGLPHRRHWWTRVSTTIGEQGSC